MLNCKEWAGRSWAKGHDAVVQAVAYEAKRLNQPVVDIDTAKKKFTHHRSGKRADLLVRSTDIEITDRAKGSGLARTQFVLDVKVIAMVNGKGSWQETWNSDKAKFENPGLLQAEAQKYRKHEVPYASAGYSFFPFVGSCFGALGPSAIRYLWSLSWLEQRQNALTRRLQGLDPLDDTARAQFRAQCFRYSSARIGAVLAKATVMRLSGAPSMPVSLPIPAAQLARNNLGVADLQPPCQVPRGRRPPSAPLSAVVHARVFLASILPPPPNVAPAACSGRLDLAVSPPCSLSPSDRLPSF